MASKLQLEFVYLQVLYNFNINKNKVSHNIYMYDFQHLTSSLQL
jgi:hypothetical protein